MHATRSPGETGGNAVAQGNDGADLEERVDAQARAESGRAARGHDVTGAGYVVAEHLVGELAKKHRARVAHPPEVLPGVSDH